MLRKIMIVLITGAALCGATTAEAFHGGGGGGGGHVGGGLGSGGLGGAHLGGGGGLGGAHLGGGLGSTHLGGFGGSRLGGQALGRAFVGPNFAPVRSLFDHDGHFGHDRVGRHFDPDRRFVRGYGYWPGWDYGYYDSSCSYSYRYYYLHPYNCYLPSY